MREMIRICVAFLSGFLAMGGGGDAAPSIVVGSIGRGETHASSGPSLPLHVSRAGTTQVRGFREGGAL